MIRRFLLFTLLFCLIAPNTAPAQFATLVADTVRIEGETGVTAEGNVEILYEGQRLLADRVHYDRVTDTIEIDGNVTLVEADGAVVTADSGAISGDLQEGILQGARLVLDREVQIAAAEMNRVDGRYNSLYKVVASSCQVCENNPTPLWQIRARRVVHDQEERQLYFDDAQFEVMGVPVAYLPQLRLPDPTLDRATGFLVPGIRTSSELGIGFRFPYFITLGRSADLTLTPYISGKTRTLEARYRQALRWGDIELNSAISHDDLRPGETRAYLFGEGRFNLPRDFKLNVDLELVSDDSYLLTYGFTDSDRLSSGVEITRTYRNEYISAGFQNLRTLRAAEIPIDETLTTLLGAATYERRFFPRFLGGELNLSLDLEGHERQADVITPALLAACTTAGATECTARDLARAGIKLGWQRDWQFANGMIGKVEGQLAGDAYWISQDTAFPSEVAHFTPAAAIELRWPLVRENGRGGRDVLEPMVQLAWTDTTAPNVPNEDSRLVEFDEGNLLSLNRFPGSNRYERGFRTTVGLSWNHFAPSGRDYALTVGRVIRADDLGQFTGASGLDGQNSDWLVAGRVQLADRLSLANRSLFDDSFSFAKSETRLDWAGRKFSASTSYIWVVAEAAEGRAVDVSEWNLDGAYKFDDNWTGTFDWRYDLATNEFSRAGIGVEYTNECVNVDLSVSRRFTSSTTVSPTTDFGLTISLNGFGTEGRGPRRSCGIKG